MLFNTVEKKNQKLISILQQIRCVLVQKENL